jgi:hypothetical protein
MSPVSFSGRRSDAVGIGLRKDSTIIYDFDAPELHD